MNISVIIFSYNEDRNIASVIKKTDTFLSSFSSEYEIIVVDDGSTDSTKEILHDYINNSKITIYTHAKNIGIGEALQTGYNVAKLEYVCAIPGDGQFDINELENVKPFDNSVYYSFYRTITNYNLYRSILTWFNRLFNQHVLGIYIRDVNWVKVYRLDQLKIVKPVLRSSLVESEICSKFYKIGVMPIEIPSKYLTRQFGIAKGGNWKTLSKAISDVWKLYWIVKNFKHKL